VEYKLNTIANISRNQQKKLYFDEGKFYVQYILKSIIEQN